jgi:hypothetical protein
MLDNMNKDYIIPLLAGRLGNNMFMVANAYAKGLEYNKQVVVCRKQLVYEGNDYSQNVFQKLEFVDVIDDNKNYNPPKPSDDKHTLYSGYFQSELYFKKYSENIKSLFAPPIEFVERIKHELPEIFQGIVTVVNVRKGDYLYYPTYHPTLSAEYINHASRKTTQTMYLVASDDILWCKQNLDLGSTNILYLENYKPEEQLWIMSFCHNFIISNSSFSWWGAYLSRYEKKKVFAPSIWYGPEGPKTWNEIYCSDWNIVDSYFENGLIHPK